MRMYRNGTIFRVQVQVSKPVASCYPSGWEDIDLLHQFYFSPAVCPSGWTYYDMASDWNPGASTAYCCNRFDDTRFCFTIII